MNMLLLLHLLVVLQSLANCTSSVITKDDDTISDLIKRRFYADLIQKITSYEFSGLDNGQIDCLQEFSQFWKDLGAEQQTAYFDSFGKVGAGILKGNVAYLGYYDECTDIGNTDYCRFSFNVTLTTTSTESYDGSVTVLCEFGMCFPSSCDAKDFYSLFFNEVFYSESFININTMNYTINVISPNEYEEPECPWRDLQWTTSSIIALTICIMFVVLVITGTMVDVLLWFIPNVYLSETEPPVTVTDSKVKHSIKEDKPEVKYSIDEDKPEVTHSINEDEPLINAKPKSRRMAKTRCIGFLKDFVLSFSLYKNIPVILATHQPANAITSINGIRVISMCWVILLHTLRWILSDDFNVITNTKEVIDTLPKGFHHQPLISGAYCVDSFFILSGLLMCYLTIKQMDRRNGKFPFVLFYVHRLLRLSPAYYLIMLFSFKVLPYIGSGPLWNLPDVNRCENYWWTNVLYINNFYPVVYSDQCYYGVTWYLANDMQFFIISPIFMLLLYYFWKIGFAIIAVIMLSSTAFIGIMAGSKDLDANYAMTALSSNDEIAFAYYNIYAKPYCRINPFLVGILLGFVLYKKWRVRCKFWTRMCFYSALWIIAGVCCLTPIFGLYGTNNGHPFSKSENVMYYMFSRTSYSIGIALVIYACHNGFGGIVNTFLSWSLWVPLSRLTFMVYLCHPIVCILMYGTMRSQVIYTDCLLIVFCAAAVLLSYSLALIVAAVVEYPLSNMESAIYKLAGLKRK